MSFFTWLLRATLMLSFVLGTGAHAGAAPTTAPVPMAAATVQAHCTDEDGSGHPAHHAAEAHDAVADAHADMQHDTSPGCCKVMSNCHCAGSHCASSVAGPVASWHGVLRQSAASFSRSVYGSPALPLSIRPPIA